MIYPLCYSVGPLFGQTSGSPPAWPTFSKSSDKDKPGIGAARTGSNQKPPPPERVDSLRPDIPPELQGVSVKDLVKALGVYNPVIFNGNT